MAHKMQALGTFSIEQKEFYERALLKRLKETFKLYNWAKKSTLPQHNGNTISWRKFLKLELPTAPLIEGVTPEANHLDIVEFKSSIKQYGDYIQITDLFDLEGYDPVVTESAELFGEQVGEYVDNIIRDELVKSCNVYYAAGRADLNNITSSDTITVTDINKVKAVLARLGAKPMVDGKYIWVIDPEVEYDLKSISGAAFIDVWKYAKPEKMIAGEIGEWLGFKWVVNNNAVKVVENSTPIKIHKTIVLGKFAGELPYGVVELEGGSAKPSIIHKPLGSSGTEDPLNQRQTLGWKINGFGARILYEEGVLIYNCYSSLTPASDLVEANRYGYSKAESGKLAITNTLVTGNLNITENTGVKVTHNGNPNYHYFLTEIADASSKFSIDGTDKMKINAAASSATATGKYTLTCQETGEVVEIDVLSVAA